MAMSTLQPPGSGSKNSSGGSHISNFAKALLEAGGNQSEVLSGQNGSNGKQTTPNFPFPGGNDSFKNFGLEQNLQMTKEQQEKEMRKRERLLLRHREINQVNVYDHRQVETERKIDQILKELEALAKDLANVNREAREVQIAVMQGAVEPGDYHLTFFEKLLNVIIMLRKRVNESATWLSSWSTRKNKKQGYWAQFHSSGTQWSMSQERVIATSVG